MYQESVDKLKGTSRSDTLLVVLLILFFFFAGSIATMLRAKFNSSVPLYVFAAVLGGLLYLVYRLRIKGFRYTVFYKEPEPEYDPRFDDYITHEDYPYPVGTLVFESTVSAKGTILLTVDAKEIKALLAPGEECSAEEEMLLSPKKKEASHSIVFEREGKPVRAYFAPSETFINHVRGLIEE